MSDNDYSVESKYLKKEVEDNNLIEEELSEEERIEKALSEKVGIKADYDSINSKNILKFLFFSGIGVFLFFIPCLKYGDETVVPMVFLVNFATDAVAGIKNYLTMIVCITLSITYNISKFYKKGEIYKFHQKDGPITASLYYLAAIFSFMIVFQVGPKQILDPEVGTTAISLAGNTMFTVTIAGWLVTFLTEFGILEFIGTLIEPVMRRVFKLPGQSAVNALSAFVAAPAVGVFMTNKLYHENVYTEKEAASIMTSFSLVSLGFFALLVSITNTPYMYGNVALTSLATAFIIAVIMIRIPPLSRKKDVYMDGFVQTAAMRKGGKYTKDIFKKALATATTKARDAEYSVLLTSIKEALSFALKIVAFVQVLTVLSMVLSIYTPVFDIIGKPMVPYLKLVGIADAEIVAPATLVGIAEIALPVMTIAGKAIAPASIFFVVVLSTVQIIFFSESANAMLQSDVGLSFGELVVIFLIRTFIAIPIVALVANFLY
ncbi:YjiH family protein [Peptoniphilus catoniae]|uniref:YjiH family protein n=1 Tax=Peptoniphilus catoniae TaxID=1660341 RepID=UPI0010FF44DA|nr:nucleoside recognition domain-containing protein [Peptoniphilus catoniae]